MRQINYFDQQLINDMQLMKNAPAFEQSKYQFAISKYINNCKLVNQYAYYEYVYYHSISKKQQRFCWYKMSQIESTIKIFF